MLRHLKVNVSDFNRIKIPKLKWSSMYVYELAQVPEFCAHGLNEELEAIVFTGAFSGEVVRWAITPSGATPLSAGFGHNNKIVQFAPTVFPMIHYSLTSLGYDGTLCVWSIFDGVCVAKYPELVPRGCQRIAVSPSAIEICVISGAFPNIYIVNIHEGHIIQTIRPHNTFIVSLSFYSTPAAEWLFSMDASGTSCYTTIDRTTATSRRTNLYASKKTILNAYPSPDFSYLLVTFDRGFSLVDLCNEKFPSNFVELSQPNDYALWLNNTQFMIVLLNSHSYIYTLPQRKEPCESHKDIIMHFSNVSDTFIDSSASSESDLQKVRQDNIDIVNPLINKKEKEQLRHEYFLQQQKLNEKSVTSKDGLFLQTEIRAPVFGTIIMPHKKTYVIAFDNKLCVGNDQFVTHCVGDSFKSHITKQVTAQCFIDDGKKVTALIEGTNTGTIRVKYLNGRKTYHIHSKSKARVTAMCTVDEFLVVATSDCLVAVYEMDSTGKVIHLATFSHFTAHVSHIEILSKRTDTDIDNAIFCVTSNNVISMIVLKKGEQPNSPLIMTGHDGHIYGMWYQPALKMLLVQCNSLYFWSLSTGNLESIVTGQQMFRYLKETSQMVVLEPPKTILGSLQVSTVKFGKMSLRALTLDINEMSIELAKAVSKHANDPAIEIVNELPHFSLMLELMPEKLRKNLMEQAGITWESKFSLGFCGANEVHTIFFPKAKLTSKSVSQVSNLASAIVMATWTMMAVPFKIHKTLAPPLDIAFLFNPLAGGNNKSASLYHVFIFSVLASPEVHDYLITTISMYPESERREWLHKLGEAVNRFPEIRRGLNLVWAVLAITLLPSLSQEHIQQALQLLTSLVPAEDIGPFIRELLARGASKFKALTDVTTLIKITATYSKEDNDKALSRYLEEFPTEFIRLAQELLKIKSSSSKPMIRQIFHYLAEGHNRSEQIKQNLLEVAMSGISMLSPSLTKNWLLMIQFSAPWFSYNPEKHSVAYSDTVAGGRLWVLRRNESGVLLKTFHSLLTNIEKVEIDPSGLYVLAMSENAMKMWVFSIQFGKDEEGKQCIQSKQQLEQPLSPTVWSGPYQLEITKDDGQTARIDFKPFE